MTTFIRTAEGVSAMPDGFTEGARDLNVNPEEMQHQQSMKDLREGYRVRSGTPADRGDFKTTDGRTFSFSGTSADPNADATTINDSQLIRIGSMELTLGQAKQAGLVDPSFEAANQPTPEVGQERSEQQQSHGDLAFEAQAAAEVVAFEEALGEQVAMSIIADVIDGIEVDDRAVEAFKRAGEGDAMAGFERMNAAIGHLNGALAARLGGAWSAGEVTHAARQIIEYGDRQLQGEYRAAVKQAISERGSSRSVARLTKVFKDNFTIG